MRSKARTTTAPQHFLKKLLSRPINFNQLCFPPTRGFLIPINNAPRPTVIY